MQLKPKCPNFSICQVPFRRWVAWEIEVITTQRGSFGKKMTIRVERAAERETSIWRTEMRFPIGREKVRRGGEISAKWCVCIYKRLSSWNSPSWWQFIARIQMPPFAFTVVQIEWWRDHFLDEGRPRFLGIFGTQPMMWQMKPRRLIRGGSPAHRAKKPCAFALCPGDRWPQVQTFCETSVKNPLWSGGDHLVIRGCLSRSTFDPFARSRDIISNHKD